MNAIVYSLIPLFIAIYSLGFMLAIGMRSEQPNGDTSEMIWVKSIFWPLVVFVAAIRALITGIVQSLWQFVTDIVGHKR